jgi:putative ABC transport system permease protein
MLRKDMVFTLVAVLSLALGTGANSTMFSLVNGLLLRPLAVSRPSEVLTIAPKRSTDSFGGVSYPDYIDFRDHMRSMKDLVASTLFRFGFSRSTDALPQVKYGLMVSGNLFRAMGVIPMLGRAFQPEEDQVPGRDAVVVLGHDFWRDEFGADPHVIGRIVRLNGVDFTVIGVAPETFTGMDEFFKVTMFVPAMMAPRLSADPDGNLLVKRDWRDFAVKGRLTAGINASQAEAELVSIAKELEQTYPATNSGQSVTLRSEMQMHFQHMPQESGFMMMAMVMAGLVLLISCFNVANLLLSRTRKREIAIRLAVGAGRAGLVRQLLMESLLLAIAGTIAGLWFAWAVAQLFNRIKVPSDLPFMVDIRSDYRVFLFSLAVGLLSVLVFGLAPALQSSKVDLVSALKSTDAGMAFGRNRLWVRNFLVVTQIGISVVILIAVTMIYRGFSSQLYGGAGFRKSHVLMMSFDPRLIRYDAAQGKEFYRRLVDQARAVPGVKSAAMGVTMPLALNQRAFFIEVAREGEQRSKDDQQKDHFLHDIVDEHFFETMAIPIVRGRGFLASDTADSPPVAVVNEALAEKYWPGESAIGKRIQIETGDRETRWVEVVGVARNCKYVWLTEAPTAYLYLPLSQNPWPRRMLFVESYGDAASLTGPIREVVHGLDSNMPVFDVRTIEEYFAAWVVGSANNMLYIVGSMGLTGLILAMIGLYGLVAYSVSRRTREFGIRMAIGAGKGSVLRMVLLQGGLLCLAGIIVGLAISFPASRVLQSVVFGAGSDWLSYAVVPLLLILVTLVAIYGPAHRASMIDPMKALRDE